MLERPRHFRTIFLSDVHLGTKSCQADLLLDFLRLHDAEAFYLIGDIVDGWQLKRSWYWPQEHNEAEPTSQHPPPGPPGDSPVSDH